MRALGVLRGMCTYLWVCTGGVEGDVYIPTGVHWGYLGGCVHTYGCALGVLRGLCTYLWVCARGVEGDVYLLISSIPQVAI